MRKGVFITATDTGAGKTIVSLALATLLKDKGIDVGFMKPVQCAGNDAKFVKSSLKLNEPLELINPFFAREPICPSVAFKRQGIKFDKQKVLNSFEELSRSHEFLIVEGAGGLSVPLTKDYFITDLIRDLDLGLLVVSRLGLGTINHTLLTIETARKSGIDVLGVIFNATQRQKSGIPEKTNPKIIKDLGKIPILGILPYLSSFTKKTILKNGKTINLSAILKEDKSPIDWQAKDKQFIWHPFTQMKDWLNEEQLIIKEAKGNYLKDTKGKWYLDGVSSLWVNLHGHRKKEIDAAVNKQLSKLSHSTLLGLGNVPSIELAEKLVKLVPKGLTKVFYSDNGSTAVEIALKIAYQYWQNIGNKEKKKFIHLENSYHGDTLGAVSVGGVDLFHKIYQPLLFKSIKVSANRLEELENILRKSHKLICALIVEPIVQAAGGIIVWPEGALRKMRQLCTKYNCFLICDEVATGFGRTGKMFACEHENVSPDILCLSKGITAGYLPLAATLTTQKIFDGFLADYPPSSYNVFTMVRTSADNLAEAKGESSLAKAGYKEQKTFFHGHTYTGNPLACAAAIANLEVFEKEKVLEKLAPKISFLKNELRKFWALKHVADIRQKGFMVGIELAPYGWQDKIGIRVCHEARKHGLILRPLGNVVVIMPPLSITKEELNQMLDIIFQAIQNVTENET